jgi:tetratricopeptide (TPR) repeat protein
MAGSKMFNEAMAAIQKGERERARDLLTRLLRTEKNNPEYWLWMSSLVDTPKERIYCLQSVIKLDPGNLSARQGLVLLGVGKPDADLVPTLPSRRKWEVEIEEDEDAPRGIRKVLANPVVRLTAILMGGVLLIGLVLAGIFGTRGIFLGPHLTVTYIPWTETPTETLTPTPEFRTPTPTPETVVPLWMLLEATYTPMPLYVNTPHPRIEAYHAGIRAYERGNYESMRDFMLQVAREEPDSPDTSYYLGEAYRLLGEYDLALNAYDAAIDTDENFAPAYLGRVRAHLAVNPQANVLADLDQAIELDPLYGEAYLERVVYWLNRGDTESAIEDLDASQEILVEYPLYYLLRAQAELTRGDHQAALKDAQEAYKRDITMLPVYQILGKAYLLNDQPADAAEFVEIFGRYQEDDPQYWVLYAWVQYELGEDFNAALDAIEKALELDDQVPDAHLVHGWISMALGEYGDAVNDFYLAKNLDPQSFDANLAFGQALLAEERYDEAINQFNTSENLAVTDSQLAAIYYYRAIALDALFQLAPAAEDYQALLDLPVSAVPTEWLREARRYLATATPTPSPSSTPTRTETPTPSFTPTRTATSTITPSPTITPSSTRTPSPTLTLTPSATRTPRPTNTPRPSATPSATPTP